MSIVGTPEWDALVIEYLQGMETAEHTEHANCDHANDYCTATVTNTFR
jgi:hypothetical protein